MLIALRDGTMRSAELRRKVNGVSERMLAKSLQQLEAHHLLTRKSYPVVPPHVEYTLTPLGQDAAVRMAGLTDWIEGNIDALIDLSRVTSASTTSRSRLESSAAGHLLPATPHSRSRPRTR